MFDSPRSAALLEELERQDPHALASRVKGLQLRRCELDAEEAELLGEVEALRAAGRSEFRDTAAWLRRHTGVAGSTARSRARVARGLAVLPEARAALGEGRI